MIDALCAVDINRFAGQKFDVFTEDGCDEPCNVRCSTGRTGRYALLQIVRERTMRHGVTVEVGHNIAGRDIEDAYAAIRPLDSEAACDCAHRSLGRAVSDIAFDADLVKE